MELEFRERKAPVPGLHGQLLAVVIFGLWGALTWWTLATAPDVQPAGREQAWIGLALYWPAAAVGAINAVLILRGRRLSWWWRLAPVCLFVAAFALIRLLSLGGA